MFFKKTDYNKGFNNLKSVKLMLTPNKDHS